MLFAVRLVTRQPHDMPGEQWQELVASQLRHFKSLYDQGKVKAMYRETGVGALAIFDVAHAQEMDQLLAALPMAAYTTESSAHAAWDMVPALQSLA